MMIAHPVQAPLLAPGELPPFNLLNPQGRSPVVILCEHGGTAVPRQLAALGLGAEHYTKHYAFDIGVRRLAETLAWRLDAPAVIANYSRLVVDLNRTIDHPTTFPVSGEGVPVPGNVAMTDADRALRLAEIYDPFHNAVAQIIDAQTGGGRVPFVIAIHSYTPVFFGQARPWDFGVLWRHDDRMARRLIADFRGHGYHVGDNEPYDARSMWGTAVNIHGDARRLPNALIEVRHDHIDSDEKSDLWAKMLGDSLKTMLADPALARYYEGPHHESDHEEERRHFKALADRMRERS